MKRYLGCGVVLMGLLLASNAFGDGNQLLTQCAAAVNFMDGTSNDTSTYLLKLIAMLSLFVSFRRKPESRNYEDFWTSVFTGVAT